MARAFAILLCAVHVGLAVWALVGFAEMVWAEVPWKRLSNPLFSPAMLALQWSLILTAAVVFIGGYVTGWHWTPVAMTAIYGMMAATCAYQTFLILVHETRFREMAIEYVEYAIILAFIWGSDHMHDRFGWRQGG